MRSRGRCFAGVVLALSAQTARRRTCESLRDHTSPAVSRIATNQRAIVMPCNAATSDRISGFSHHIIGMRQKCAAPTTTEYTSYPSPPISARGLVEEAVDNASDVCKAPHQEVDSIRDSLKNLPEKNQTTRVGHCSWKRMTRQLSRQVTTPKTNQFELPLKSNVSQ